jgi:signal transduction histidine kinase
MRRPRPNSIRWRLFGLAGAISALTVAIAGTLFILNDLSMLRRQMVRDLEVLAVVIGDNCLAALEFDAPQTAERNLASLRREYQIRVAALFDAGGRLFAAYRRDADQPLPALPRHEDGVVVVTPLLGLGRVEVLRTLHLDGQPIGRIIIQASTDELAAQRHRYALIAAGLLATTLALSLLLAWRMQRRISEPILGLADKTEEISKEGDYRMRISEPPSSFDEIETLAKGLNQLLTAIQEREAELESHAVALDSANGRLRSLATEISLVEERERKRLATELHDSAMQKLAIARLQIEGVAERPASATEAAHDERLDVGLALIREVLGELRSLQFELSPPSLYLGGLPQALQSLAAHITARCGIAIDYVEPYAVPEPPLELAVVLYQCARELVYNVVKHARARKGVILVSSSDGGLDVEVRDDGQGFQMDAATPPYGGSGGYGLYSVRERLAVLGGGLSVESGAQGSRVIMHVPMDAPVSTPSHTDPQVTEDTALRPLKR